MSDLVRRAPVAMADVAVAMLARNPLRPGKTRLTSGLTEASATALRTALLLDALESALAPGWPVHIYVDPGEDVAVVERLVAADPALAALAPRCHLHPQAHGDLGQRMSHAVARTLGAGGGSIVLVGSDTPDLPLEALQQAASAVAVPPETPGAKRLVFGPAYDGGFYLMAARHAEAAAFIAVAWSRPTVLADVVARARALGREVGYVTTWGDIDTPEDLAALAERRDGAARTRALIATCPGEHWPPGMSTLT